MNVKLGEHLTFKKIFKATILPILLMLFSSFYGIVDGFCISTFEGKDAFAGVNLIFPCIMIIGCIGFIFGSGGCALVSKYLGQKQQDKANNAFTNIVIVNFLLGLVVSLVVFFFIDPIANAMASITKGTTEGMVKEAIKYGRIMTLGQCLFMTQNTFGMFLLADEKPNMGFLFTLMAGITNIIFDFLFIGVFKWGVIGAASATILGYIAGSLGPIIFFLKEKNGVIKFVKPVLALKDIGQTMFNGLSEFVTNVAGSIVSIIFNIQLLKFYGQVGVSAYGAVMYLSFIFFSIFFGFCSGTSPFISFSYGANNKVELNNILKKSLIIMLIGGVSMTIISFLLSTPFGYIFSSGDKDIRELTSKAMRIYSFVFMFAGFSVLASSFFTSLNNGLISSIISILRALVFNIAFVFLFPLLMGAEGIWYSITASDVVSTCLSFIFLFAMDKKYGYLLKNKKDCVIADDSKNE